VGGEHDGGEHDTEGAAGTIVVGSTECIGEPVAAVGADGSTTEGTIADAPNPTTDEAVTDPTPGPVEPVGAVPASLDTVAEDTVAEDAAAAAGPGASIPEANAAEVVAPEPAAVPAPEPEAAEQVSTRRRRTGLVSILTVLSLVVVGVGVGSLIWSRTAKKKASPPPAAPTATTPTLPDGSFVTFKDSEAGFSIRYPRGWTRSQPPVAEIRLQASDGKQYSTRVRVTHTEQATTAANLANLKAVTDGIVSPGAQILKQDPITVNGLIGYRYIYTLTDKDSGLTSAHLHYFLFQGHKMNSIVFEAVPTETFSRIEGIFGQMLESFHSDPEPPS